MNQNSKRFGKRNSASRGAQPGLEGDEAEEPEEIERDRDPLRQRREIPERDDEERREVDLVGPLVEGLVAVEAAPAPEYDEQVEEEQVEQVAHDRDKAAPERPAQDEQGTDDPIKPDEHDHGVHGDIVGGGARRVQGNTDPAHGHPHDVWTGARRPSTPVESAGQSSARWLD